MMPAIFLSDWSIFLRVTAPDLLENPCLQLLLNYYIAARISTPTVISLSEIIFYLSQFSSYPLILKFVGQLHINIKTFMHKQAIKHKQAIIGGGYLFTENACYCL